jgi:cation:H+ antiporter
MYNITILLVSLIAILIVAILFCNALEHLGEKLGISEGVTGSIFAAVGTALPETIIPFLAFFGATKDNANVDIGIGAILGAPLMLSTLSVFIMAAFISRKRGINGVIQPEPRGLKRDLQFFLISYSLAFCAALIPQFSGRKFCLIIIAISLGITYFVYLLITVKDSASLVKSGHQTQAKEGLFLQRLGIKANHVTIMIQLILATLLLVYFSETFISSVNDLAVKHAISPFLLSLIIIPIATELPEKVNSVLWLHKGRDTLAMGNITGALVFQGSLLPILGILATDWGLNQRTVLVNIIITLIAVLWMYMNACRGVLRVWHFAVNGMLYVVNISICGYLLK